jgi:hypothetical protein
MHLRQAVLPTLQQYKGDRNACNVTGYSPNTLVGVGGKGTTMGNEP